MKAVTRKEDRGDEDRKSRGSREDRAVGSVERGGGSRRRTRSGRRGGGGAREEKDGTEARSSPLSFPKLLQALRQEQKEKRRTVDERPRKEERNVLGIHVGYMFVGDEKEGSMLALLVERDDDESCVQDSSSRDVGG